MGVPRTNSHTHGPIDERGIMGQTKRPWEKGYVAPTATAPSSSPKAGEAGSSPLAKSASESVLDRRSAVDILAGIPQATRAGPHWPPPTKERPDPVRTRATLFQGKHRTFCDHHQRDRQAPVGWQYTLPNI